MLIMDFSMRSTFGVPNEDLLITSYLGELNGFEESLLSLATDDKHNHFLRF